MTATVAAAAAPRLSAAAWFLAGVVLVAAAGGALAQADTRSTPPTEALIRSACATQVLVHGSGAQHDDPVAVTLREPGVYRLPAASDDLVISHGGDSRPAFELPLAADGAHVLPAAWCEPASGAAGDLNVGLLQR